MTDTRSQMRQPFLDTWNKRHNKQLLSPLEQQILGVIEQHPEYHALLDQPDIVEKDYRTDNNPFLHMSLHLGLIEQLTTNRPHGIRTIYQTLYEKFGEEHPVQHLMMEIMAETIFNAQSSGQLPDETHYLKQLEQLLRH